MGTPARCSPGYCSFRHVRMHSSVHLSSPFTLSQTFAEQIPVCIKRHRILISRCVPTGRARSNPGKASEQELAFHLHRCS